MSRILDPRFKYVPASQTDIRKTFARVRKEIAARAAAEKATPSLDRERKILALEQRPQQIINMRKK